MGQSFSVNFFQSLHKEEWREVRLGEVAEIITSGGTPKSSTKEYYHGAIPWLNTKEVKNNRIYITEKTITEAGLANSSAKWIEKDSVIVAMYGATAGKVAINKIPLTTNQACCNITLSAEKANYNFIYYMLLNSFDRLDQMTSGAAQQNLNVGLISNFNFLLPPLPIQNQIASILSSFDDKIDLLHRQNQTLESLALTLFRHYFIENPKNPISGNVNNRDKFGGATLVAQMESQNPSSAVKTAPLMWKIGKLADYVHISSGKSLKREFFKETGKYEILGANGTIGKTDKYLYNERLIYTGRVGTLGKIFMIDYPKKVWLSDNTLIIKPKEQYFHFIYFLLQELKLENYNVGSTQPLIRQSDLLEIKIMQPDSVLMFEFEQKAKGFFDKIYNNSKQIQSLEQMRDLVLRKLLNMKVGL